jgi:Tfp pilus assembly protein PilZ
MTFDHLEFANLQRRVLYSFNVGDYQQLHTAYVRHGKRHSGIILAQQQRYRLGEQMRRLLKIVALVPAEEMTNSIVFLSAW